MGRGAFALAVIGIAGCSPAATASGSPTRSTSPSGAPPGPSDQPQASATTGTPPSGPPPSGDAVTWERVNLGFVSAYILVRGGEAAIVDTGVGGSADDIEASLAIVGIDWSAVGHLILTHHHDDHVGSATEIQRRAPDVLVYAGAEDIPRISGLLEPPTAVGDGDVVFDLQIVTTPGHTAGSISVFDPVGGILVAGDALRTDGGRPSLPGAQFTVDMDEAVRSIAKLGALTFETLLVGHGDPVEGGASAAVAELAAQQ
jgi:glyoxylase-like metal-dependent hydrolase (beta-lactamase superfamily II)